MNEQGGFVEALESRRLMCGTAPATGAPAGDAIAAATVVPLRGVNKAAAPTPIVEVAGRRFTTRLGSFKFRGVDVVASATIDWGDGRTSKATIVRNPAGSDTNVV